LKIIREATVNLLRNTCAIGICVLSVVVIYFPSWYAPEHAMAVHGALILLVLFAWYVEWRSGMLSLRLDELHAEVRRRGVRAFGWVRPLPVLALGLLSVASYLMPSRY